ncbi:MAG: RteC domain-containing protein [Flavisolibacter sp.]
MKVYSRLLLYLMHIDLQNAQNENADPVRHILNYYDIVDRYWNILSEKLSTHKFESNQEEINFFKEIKPLFTSEIEFASLVYQLEIFTPLTDLEFASFIKKERSRFCKFKEKNKEFYRYYKDGRKEFDEMYFLRSRNMLNYFVHTRPYDLNICCCTSHDHLVSTILGLEKYEAYLNKKYPDHAGVRAVGS